ncbi:MULTISPECIES: hypothetical protein [unclassified Corynebacterium]|uniref:hypothetical protein n=1 Tax=unclassified Corynebacterium TaxID=2624378 RepID=UPI0021690574|nr:MULTISPECIES: hypothetical protein [unclassified Corynebacterium]MCS4489501.1 hypothetical protein [Corynebacterium sp. ES2775-CONJ]MCS4491488.1 hypothetical protein [Corynebacterium sp. ES2715-CONJ3]
MQNPNKRRTLVHQAIIGFLAFFSVLFVIQAALNLLQPEPALWPAVLALLSVITTVVAVRAFSGR